MINKLKQEKLGLWLVLALLCVPLIFRNFNNILNIHFSRTRIGIAIVSFLLLGSMFRDRRWFAERPKQIRWIFGVMSLFFLSTVVGGLHHILSPWNYLAGFWNNSKFFLFFFACILYLKEQNREDYLRFLDWVFVVNFFASIFEFFVLDIKWDNLGGIFGTDVGSGETHMLQLVVITSTVVRFLNKEEAGWKCLTKCAMALTVAALAELKIFYVEFLGIVVLVVLMNKFDKRMLGVLILGAVGLFVSMKIMIQVYPHWAGWFNLEYMFETVTNPNGYTGQGDFNRLTAIPRALNEFLNTPGDTLFGLGLGNCDMSPFAGMNTDFYMANMHLNYTFFSSGFVMLETGVVGTVLYVCIFLTMLIGAHTLERSKNANQAYCQIAKILAIISLGLFFYDATLRSEHSYYLYFALALPFVGRGVAKKTAKKLGSD